MIELHHVGPEPHPFILNADLIYSLEAKPETIIHLTDGHHIRVTESAQEVTDAVRAWKASVIALAETLGQEAQS